MANNAFVIRDPYVEVDGVDLSPWVREVEVDRTTAEEDDTASGAGGSTSVHGLRKHKFTVKWKQSHAAGEVDATLEPLYENEEEFEVIVGNTASPFSSTNPAWAGYCKLFVYKPISGAIGDLSEVDTEFSVQGAIYRKTT